MGSGGLADNNEGLFSFCFRFEFTNEKWMLFGIADDHSFMSSPAIKAQFTPDKPISKSQLKIQN